MRSTISSNQWTDYKNDLCSKIEIDSNNAISSVLSLVTSAKAAGRFCC